MLGRSAIREIEPGRGRRRAAREKVEKGITLQRPLERQKFLKT
jgi:hypothetical protein